MAMIKYVSPAGWDFDRTTAVPVKFSSQGLLGADRQDFVKTAGHAFEPILDTVKFAKDEYPIHIIALGASEAYGPNRNGDAFSEKTCRDQCHTFTKFARFFRNHKNKPEKGHPHFGLVKAAVYNEKMRRVELLVGLNMDKSACDRNGGFVADVELDKMAKDGDIPVSMACRVPYDVCSWCNNKAPSRKQYCTTEKCAAGGCAKNLTRLVKVGGDIHHLHVKNPNCVWFDISRVFRPADRIAYGTSADYLEKAAADGGVFDLWEGIKLADDDSAPYEVTLYQDGMPGQWNTKIAAQIKLAYGLAHLETVGSGSNPAVYAAFTPSVQHAFPVEVLGEPGTEKCASALGALADRMIILPLRDFARLVKQEEFCKEAAMLLPGVYSRMVDDGSLDRRVEQSKYPLSEKVAQSVHRAAANMGYEAFSLEKAAIDHRCMLAAIRGIQPTALNSGIQKTAGDCIEGEQLARDYAVYKLAALERIANFDPKFVLTCKAAIVQNRVI